MITQPHPAFGWLLVALFAVAAVLALLNKPARLCKQPEKLAPFKAPALAVEFADSASRVAEIYEGCEPKMLSQGLDQDDRIIIPVYASLLPFVIALVFLCMPAWVPAPLRIVALALGVCLVGAAAWSDSRENAALRRILDKTTDAQGVPLKSDAPQWSDIKQDLSDLRAATTAKWTLLFAAFVVAGLMMITRGGWWSVAVALSYLLFAVLGLFSLFSSRYPLLEFTFNLIGLPLLLTGLWLAFPPPRASGDNVAPNQKFLAAQTSTRPSPRAQ
ncbi:MAG: hypothetical protein QOF61_166 [Acidobacteriota bacterium]|jgi:hypothetical protein|nr:hypothetical protein [Acidobacteriota bacterium]